MPEPTLRAWERRYGIPTPERTAAGYRLYGAKEVDQVRGMLRLCAGGMSAAEAAARLRSGGPATDDVRVDGPRVNDPAEAACDAILAAVEQLDEKRLDLELRRAMLLGSSLTVIDHVLTPTLRTIGTRWEAGDLSVAQEHLASQRIRLLMHDMLRLALPVDSPRALLACFAEEQHEMGLIAVGARLATWGIRPVLLGACTPPDAVRASVAALKPRFVALSVTVAPEQRRMRPLVAKYAVACGSAPWLVGGSATASMGRVVRSCGGAVAPEDHVELRMMVSEMLSRSVGGRTRRLRPMSDR
ncbi:MAG: B12-binding domain-containing protein [Myxococcota bacterium]|nr:B12-binding domain-containing protein [Myxococcota bacterium]